jgi:hypothetical protein
MYSALTITFSPRMRSLITVEVSQATHLHEKPLLSLAVDAHGSPFVASGTDGIDLFKGEDRLAHIEGTTRSVFLHWLAGRNTLSVVLGDGRLFLLQLDEDNDLLEVGRLDCSIDAAQWSPDEELLAVATGASMSRHRGTEHEDLLQARATCSFSMHPLNWYGSNLSGQLSMAPVRAIVLECL